MRRNGPCPAGNPPAGTDCFEREKREEMSMLTSLTLCSILEPGGESMTKLQIFLKQIVNTQPSSKTPAAPGRPSGAAGRGGLRGRKERERERRESVNAYVPDALQYIRAGRQKHDEIADISETNCEHGGPPSKIVCARQKRLLLPGTVCFEERERIEMHRYPCFLTSMSIAGSRAKWVKKLRPHCERSVNHLSIWSACRAHPPAGEESVLLRRWRR